MKNTFSVFAYSYWMKIVGILLIVWGIYRFFSNYREYDVIDLNLISSLSCWGLVFIFFSKEKTDDERIHQMKFQALTWAVPIGLFATHLINYWFLGKSEYNSSSIMDSISAYHALLLILLLAFGLFHYLKHNN
jgi:CDP-diglyceride synthetase